MNVDILAFGAHPDDVELSAGGSLLKQIHLGKTVAIVDLTKGELGSRGSELLRLEEAKNASEILGIMERVNLGFSDGFFEHNQIHLIKIIEQIRYFKPKIVLANAVEDRHPDHSRASKLVSDACFLAGLIKIETFYLGVKQECHRPKVVYHYIQDRYIKPDFVVDVSPFYQKKMNAILAYKTQFFNQNIKGPQTPISGKDFLDFLNGRMAEFGRPIGVSYAEGFTTERLIGINDFSDLI